MTTVKNAHESRSDKHICSVVCLWLFFGLFFRCCLLKTQHTCMTLASIVAMMHYTPILRFEFFLGKRRSTIGKTNDTIKFIGAFLCHCPLQLTCNMIKIDCCVEIPVPDFWLTFVGETTLTISNSVEFSSIQPQRFYGSKSVCSIRAVTESKRTRWVTSIMRSYLSSPGIL